MKIKNDYRDDAGHIWLGFHNSLLAKFDPDVGEYTTYMLQDTERPRLGPPSKTIGIVEDDKGILWLASQQGLIRFDPDTETFKRYTEKDGLLSNFVVGMLEGKVLPNGKALPNGKGGNLWLSTQKGLSKFDLRQETFQNYDVADDLQGNEFIARAAWQTTDGQMFFGGTRGLTAFYPDQVEDNPYQPPVLLTEFQLFHQPVLPEQDSPLPRPIWETDNLTLTYDQNIENHRFGHFHAQNMETNYGQTLLSGLAYLFENLLRFMTPTLAQQPPGWVREKYINVIVTLTLAGDPENPDYVIEFPGWLLDDYCLPDRDSFVLPADVPTLC